MFSNNFRSLCPYSISSKSVMLKIPLRTKKTHWSVLKKKIHPKDKALEHFDDFYGSVYGKRWKSMRLALLSPHKYMAVVNNFGNADITAQNLEWMGAINIKNIIEMENKKIENQSKIIKRKSKNINELEKKLEKLLLSNDIKKSPSTEIQKSYVEKASLQDSLAEAECDESRIIDPENHTNLGGLHQFVPATEVHGKTDWIPESQHYQYYKEDSDFPIILIEEDKRLIIPQYLQVYTFDRGDISPFPHPKTGITKVSNYYLLDGGSILPVLALDLQPNDKVLDMCSAPGGKALVMLQTLFPENLLCNDVQESRLNKLHKVMSEYIYDYKSWGTRLMFSQLNATEFDEPEIYNKILVDVPCTNDRHNLQVNENNIFKPTRAKERLQLPELQASILSNALKNVAVGGTVVYSTCSLSPIQNDGVVKMALKQIWEDTNHQIIVKDLKNYFKPLNSLYSFEKELKLGQMVVPFLPLNYGPLYCCKLVRIR
ncbi:5-methylcytosine rRNA methyltransferase NSUN4 [Daktulosphaira vitifoliae]|uniref:5-methylcytosine rRNA methyltransferase NSUN4 n=1 Tax=Daktulosphaira vitifoliae TaxID=58002 RepID=UPI0021A9E09D|nr:5-methylcytosine rRNA methyltransferase NSUN4 [Daktulosphaira vitifoliae]